MVIFHSYVKLPEGTYWPGLLLGTIYIHLPHPFSNRKEMDIRIRHRRQSQEPPVDHQEIMVRPEFLVFLHVLWVSLNKGHVTWSKKNIHQSSIRKYSGITSVNIHCWYLLIVCYTDPNSPYPNSSFLYQHTCPLRVSELSMKSSATSNHAWMDGRKPRLNA